MKDSFRRMTLLPFESYVLQLNSPMSASPTPSSKTPMDERGAARDRD